MYYLSKTLEGLAVGDANEAVEAEDLLMNDAALEAIPGDMLEAVWGEEEEEEDEGEGDEGEDEGVKEGSSVSLTVSLTSVLPCSTA